MNETTTTTGAETTTNEAQTAPVETTTTAPPKAPRKRPAKNESAESKAPPRKAPQLKLSARQRSNVDAFDNGAATSASVINHVLACATAPLTCAEITARALAFAPDKFNEQTAHGRVSNHLRHLLVRALIVNVAGAWRIVGAVNAATKQLRDAAPAKLKRISAKGAPKNESAESEAPPASE